MTEEMFQAQQAKRVKIILRVKNKIAEESACDKVDITYVDFLLEELCVLCNEESESIPALACASLSDDEFLKKYWE